MAEKITNHNKSMSEVFDVKRTPKSLYRTRIKNTDTTDHHGFNEFNTKNPSIRVNPLYPRHPCSIDISISLFSYLLDSVVY